MAELKPCPFCGSDDIDEQFALGPSGPHPGCMNCGAMAETVYWWNRRVEPKSQAKEGV
jgi:hypothetical protein